MQVRQAATIGRWSSLYLCCHCVSFAMNCLRFAFLRHILPTGRRFLDAWHIPLYAVSPSDDGKDGVCEAFMSYPFPCAKLLKEIHRRQDCGCFFSHQRANAQSSGLQTRFPNNTDKASPQPEEALSAFLYISHLVSIYFPFEMQSFPFAATPTAKRQSPPP